MSLDFPVSCSRQEASSPSWLHRISRILPSADTDDEVEIIEQWDQRLKSTQQYKIAVVLLNSRKQGVPSLEKMMDYLLAFAGLSTEHCFPPEGSKQLEEFNKLQDQIQLDATKSVAGRKRKWTKSFCAEKIAMRGTTQPVSLARAKE